MLGTPSDTTRIDVRMFEKKEVVLTRVPEETVLECVGVPITDAA